jgi:hypothetical protein
MTMVSRVLLAAAALMAAMPVQGAQAAENDGPPPDPAIPSMIGTWTGRNDTIGDIYGLRSRPRTVQITEQTDRRFRGYFTYEGGRVDFFGIVFPDNISFAWTSPQSKSTVQGRLMPGERFAACYIEAGAEATAGCSDLTRTSTTPVIAPRPAVANPPNVAPWPAAPKP